MQCDAIEIFMRIQEDGIFNICESPDSSAKKKDAVLSSTMRDAAKSSSNHQMGGGGYLGPAL